MSDPSAIAPNILPIINPISCQLVNKSNEHAMPKIPGIIIKYFWPIDRPNFKAEIIQKNEKLITAEIVVSFAKSIPGLSLPEGVSLL